MKIKKITSVLVALCLTFSLGTVAFAAEDTASPVRVMLDGQYLNLGEDGVISINGRTMVACENFMQAVGAETELNAAANKITVTLGQTTVAMLESAVNITVTKNGFSQNIKADVPPTVVGGMLYIPVRAISEALGLSVSWDSAAQTVVLIDIPKLLDGVDAQYSITNKMMQMTVNPEKAYKTTATMTQDQSISEGPGKSQINNKVDYVIDMLTKNADMSMTMNMKYQMDPKMIKDASAEDVQSVALINEIMKDMKINMIYNSADETFYINFGALNAIMGGFIGQTFTEKTWIQFDMSALSSLYGTSSETMKKIMSGDMSGLTMGTMYGMMLNNQDIYSVDSYGDIKFALDLSAELLGDKCYTVAGTPANPEYTYKINNKMISDAVDAVKAKSPDTEFDTSWISAIDIDATSYTKVLGAHSFKDTLDLTLTMNMGDLLAIAVPEMSGLGIAMPDMTMNMKMDCTVPGKTTFDMTFDVTDDSISVAGAMKGQMDMVESTEKVPSAPPADAEIIDLGVLLGAMFSGAITQ